MLKCLLLSHVSLFMEFSRQEYWSGLLFPSPKDLPDPGIKPGSPELQACSLPSEAPEKPSVSCQKKKYPEERLKRMQRSRRWQSDQNVKAKKKKKKCCQHHATLSCCCCLVSQSCLTLCDSTDCSLTASSVHGISQARILEWVAISSSRVSSQLRDGLCISYMASGFFTLSHKVLS